LPSFFGLDHAHIWGIGSTGFTVLNGPASMAVVSVEGYEEGLIRRVSVDSHFAGITADTERRLETAEELDDALRWASRPHMAHDELARLAILMPSEVETVQEELASLEQGMRQLVNELAEIDEALF
ncbi:hypothetical protein KC963_05200, partial [Candidatus Saccharibacteria bacterium]|nr:hypothetical protein [Candidatus Saccharibacteria bacterium]